MQTYIQTFAASQTWVLNIPGKYFSTLQATNALNVRFYKGGTKLDLGEINGLGVGLEVGPLAGPKEENAFDRVEIDVTGPDTVKVGIGNGLVHYNNAVATVTVGTNKVAQGGAFANVNKTVTNASASLLAANATRQYLLIQNKDASGSIYINFGSAASIANGVKIGPGGFYESGSIASTQQIFAIGDIASNANIVTVEG